MRKQIKLWVMISDPNGETRSVPFMATTVEKCIDKLHCYLETYTGPGTTAEVIQSGYIYTGGTRGRRQQDTTKKQCSVD